MRACRRFRAGIPHWWVGSHVLLTRPPLPARKQGVRLACVRHAASVYPEPGSNSPSIVIYCPHGIHRVSIVAELYTIQVKLLIIVQYLAVRRLVALPMGELL